MLGFLAFKFLNLHIRSSSTLLVFTVIMLNDYIASPTYYRLCTVTSDTLLCPTVTLCCTSPANHLSKLQLCTLTFVLTMERMQVRAAATVRGHIA